MVHSSNKILELYKKGHSAKEISKKLGVCPGTVYNYYNKFGIDYKKKINEDFFNHWSESSSYVFGYFLGDGSLNRIRDKYFQIDFTSKDLEILEKIKKAMASNHSISRRKKSTGLIEGRVINRSESFKFQIANKKIINSLFKLGVCEHKTYNGLNFYPEVPESFHRHLLRGLLDSDGCVSHYQQTHSRKALQVSFIFSSEKMAEWASKMIPFEHKSYIRNNNVNLYLKIVHKIEELKKIYFWLYNNSNIFLNRKKENFDEWMESF